jgi:NADH-quinone oxidoreductase subunit I
MTTGTGFVKGMWVTLRHFINTYVDDVRYGFRKYSPAMDNFTERQGPDGEGAFTVQYPDEKIAMAERFRFVPFLVVEDYDHPDRPGKDWCTSCGICAKVCPPQCIWIVRSEGPDGKPIPEPEAFFIDIDICMNCGYCAEFCPFDAIKMDHDYELASYDRTSNHIFDKPKLQKEFRYWKSIAPTRAVEEAQARGGWEHKDAQKAARRGPKPTDAAAASATAAAPVADKEAKRDEVRARRAAAEAPVAAAPSPVAENSEPTPATASAGSGEKPWTASHDDMEKRKAAALARKAARASKRGE